MDRYNGVAANFFQQKFCEEDNVYEIQHNKSF